MARVVIGPVVAGPSPDRAPDWVAAGAPQPLRGDLEALLGADRVLSRPLDLVRYASDASPYRLFPKAVVMARDADDVSATLDYGRRTGVGVTLRSGGTSLNGQSQGDGILVDVRRHFTGVAVEEGGELARVGPGTVLGHANRILAPHGRKLGPDPASTEFATVGGVIANNSGGMRCGTRHDSYSTVRELTLLLASGTRIDTGAPDAEGRFAELEPKLAAGLIEIRDEIRDDTELADRIRRKFQIKNTTGYRLCAFLDGESPLEIFRRLVVGSEGTLAFVAEALFETVPLLPRTITGWVHFSDIGAAADPVPGLVAAGASAVELMVAPALIAAGHSIPGTPAYWRDLPPESAALLIEFRSDTAGDLDEMEAAARSALGGRRLLSDPEFTRDDQVTEVSWRVREGMHGIVGRLRPRGTALIIEDVCVPPERIAESATDIQALLAKHGFLTGVAGHASAGNLHFMLTPEFSEAAERDRYEAFMGELVDLVVDKYDGSLKAEHGTGINMAPYVEREWGPKATELMWRVKRLADPEGVLAPGVVLNEDPGVHLRNLKTTPEIEEVADTCVECGFCEPVCPSRHLTTTPRQRIALRREIARQPAGSPLERALRGEYEYDGIETCAADGACVLACPVGINTGTLIKEFRAAGHGAAAERSALRLARRFRTAEQAARGGLRVGGAVRRAAGDRPLVAATRGARRLLGSELVPEWVPGMPSAASRDLPTADPPDPAAVYFPACINRIFGPPDREGAPVKALPDALVAVSEHAGLPLRIPRDVAGRCCGTPWASKGFAEGHAWMANKTFESLWRWSDSGRLPIVIDASSCTHGLAAEAAPALSEPNRERHSALEFVDAIAWATDRLLPRLAPPRAKLRSAAVHPTCSGRHLGIDRGLGTLAAALAEEVFVPPSAGCCGFAGDRGFLHPELTRAATIDQAAEVASRDFDAYLSSNRTCEVAMQRATGRPYVHAVQSLEELTRAD